MEVFYYILRKNNVYNMKSLKSVLEKRWYDTIEANIKKVVEEYNNTNWKTILNKIDPIIYSAINDTDPAFWSVDKKWVGHGTWKGYIWLNEYHWGENLYKYILNACKKGIITHDEDKEFTLEDFADEIEDAMTSFAQDYWDELD